MKQVLSSMLASVTASIADIFGKRGAAIGPQRRARLQVESLEERRVMSTVSPLGKPLLQDALASDASPSQTPHAAVAASAVAASASKGAPTRLRPAKVR